MNANKAQEYFSSYFEGELEGGLLEQFERTLKQDAQVQAEYRAFVQTMTELEALKTWTAEPPEDLHELISKRMDQRYYELDRSPAQGLWTMWRKVAFGAIAVLAIAGAAASIWNMNRNASIASPFPNIGGTRSDRSVAPKKISFSTSNLELSLIDGKWTLGYMAEEAQTITIQSDDASQPKKAEIRAGDKLSSELNSDPSKSIVIEALSTASQNPVWIALPGDKESTAAPALSGKMADFAAALAAKFHKPVVVVSKQADEKFEFDLSVLESPAAAGPLLEKFGYVVEQKENGVIWIL